jgi:hypothetical protein
MMLSKETGAVFIMVFGLAYLVENYQNLKTRPFWRNLAFLAVPVFTYVVFLILHYFKFGVFFFSEHLGYITTDIAAIKFKFDSATSTLFLAHGRNLIFFTAILALVILIIKRKKMEYSRFLILTPAILIPFLTFAIFNFFTYRYVFPVMGITLLASLALIQQIKIRLQVINAAFLACIFSVSIYYTATKRGHSDADLGYTEFLVIYKQIAKYCEDHEWYEKEMATSYNVGMGLRFPYAGYLSSERTFKTNSLPGIMNRDIIIYDSTINPDVEMLENEKSKLKLIKRFIYKKHWAEIYSVQ